MFKAYELRKLDPHQEKSTTVEAQCEMCSRHMSRKNLTHAKRNSLWWECMGKCARGV
ncbi:hypothetical protein GW17_00055000 [Ensete ventricosum]|nr:hypothetical protein GW17_00055000 [Ensete ventricosum]